MPSNSSPSRRVERKARGATPGHTRRLTLEPLEDRTLLDAALANLVDARLAVVQTGLAAVVKTTAELPFINSKMDEIAASSQTALQQVRNRLRPILTAFDATRPAGQLEEQLHAALTPLGVIHDVNGNNTTRDDVKVERDATVALTVTLNLGREVVAKGFTFGLGLPGVPLKVDAGGLDVLAGAFYDGLGVRVSPAGTPTFDASTPDVAGASARALFMRNVEIKGGLGFLAVTARPVGANELRASITADVTGPGLLANPRLNGGAEANIKLTADFNAASLLLNDQGEYPPYPRVATTLHLDWNLDGSNPLDARQNLGQEPTVEFRNVTLNLGTYLSSVLGPVASTIRDFMRPMDPILKIITTEIPGLSDLSKEIGAGPITLKTLAKIAGGSGQLPPDYQLLFDLFDATTSLHELLIQVDPSSPTLEFDVGSFSLAGNNVRGKVLTVTIDTTSGGFADRVTLDWEGIPFGPPGVNKLSVIDQVGANQLHGRGTYELTSDRLTRRKLMPLKFGSLGLRGGTGTATIDFAGIDLDEVSLRGGDQGYDFDVQSTREGTRYTLEGGAGADTFTLGQVHHNLPFGTGQERQLGFVAANVAIDGRGSAQDRLVLDDSGSDYVLYGVRNTYDVTGNEVRLESVQDSPEGQETVNSTFGYKRIENLVLKTGGRNDVNVRDTMRSQGFVGDAVKTEILGGRGDDFVNVVSTRTRLSVDPGGGTNQVAIGSVPDGIGATLDGIRAEVRLVGPAPGAVNTVGLIDTGNDLGYAYTLTPDRFARAGAADVVFDGLVVSRLLVRTGAGVDVFDIDGTPITPDGPGFGTFIVAGDGDDLATVRATDGPISLDLGGGERQGVAVGDATHSLDTIGGDLTVSGAGEIDATLTDTASANRHYVTLDSDFFHGQALARQDSYYNQPPPPSRRFLFSFPGLVARYLADEGNATDSVGGHHGTAYGSVKFGDG